MVLFKADISRTEKGELEATLIRTVNQGSKIADLVIISMQQHLHSLITLCMTVSFNEKITFYCLSPLHSLHSLPSSIFPVICVEIEPCILTNLTPG